MTTRVIPTAGGPDPLDRIIAEQAAYYGLTVDRFGIAMAKLGEAQERAEAEDWPCS